MPPIDSDSSVPVFSLATLVRMLDERQPTTHLQQLFDYANDVKVLGLTLDGEGRNQSIAARAAIAWTVRNRKEHYAADRNLSYAQVCLRKYQYSCWWKLGGEENWRRTLERAQWLFQGGSVAPSGMRYLEESRYIADGVIRGVILDPTGGATHYCTTELYTRNAPGWAAGATYHKQIEGHIFFAGVK